MNPLASAGLWKLLGLGGAALYLASKIPSRASQSREVSVTGEGEVDCEPDFARVRVAVRTRAKVAKEASTELQAKVATVIGDLLDKAEIPKLDLQTTNLSIRQERHKPEDSKEYITEYVAYTEVSVKVREIDKLGMVLDVASDAGIDELEDLSFDLQDATGPKRRAMALAVQNARAQAEVLAQNAGMKLGSVIQITDGPDYNIQRSGGMLSSSMGYGEAIATGTIVVHAQAFLRIELLPLER